MTSCCSGEKKYTQAGEIPACFVKFSLDLKRLAQRYQDHPADWCRQLLKDGLQDQLLKLDASVRVKLGPQVEQQLRAVKVLAQYDCLEADQPHFVSQKESWADKDVIRQGILAFLDLVHLSSNDETLGLMAALPKLEQVKQDLRSKVLETVKQITKRVTDSKEDLEDVWAKLQTLLRIATDASAATTHEWLQHKDLLEIVSAYNKDHKPLKRALEGLVMV